MDTYIQTTGDTYWGHPWEISMTRVYVYTYRYIYTNSHMHLQAKKAKVPNKQSLLALLWKAETSMTFRATLAKLSAGERECERETAGKRGSVCVERSDTCVVCRGREKRSWEWGCRGAVEREVVCVYERVCMCGGSVR